MLTESAEMQEAVMLRPTCRSFCLFLSHLCPDYTIVVFTSFPSLFSISLRLTGAVCVAFIEATAWYTALIGELTPAQAAVPCFMEPEKFVAACASSICSASWKFSSTS
jgi:hypothetical protein